MTKENEPVAWHVSDKNGQVWACVESEDEALQIARDFSNTDDNHMAYSSFPVYRQITLTDEEIEAIEWYANFHDGIHRDTLRNLLERTKENK
jgi:hypothetical protein